MGACDITTVSPGSTCPGFSDETIVSARPGTGFLDVARVERRSVVRRAFAASPLRLLTPKNHGTAAWVYASSYGGGLVGGDDLRLTVKVGPEASVFLSSQASTKVYRSRSRASLQLDAEVAAGGQLIVWPDPVICFAGSTYRQQQRVELAGEAGLILVDTLSSGRRTSGERWLFAGYESRLTVRHDGRPILLDALRLSRSEGDLAARMGRFDVLSTVVIAGPRWRDAATRAVAAAAERRVERRADMLMAAAPLQQAGCLLRIAGRSVEQVSGVIRGCLSCISSFLNDDPWARKW
jgi:urease accessory protein